MNWPFWSRRRPTSSESSESAPSGLETCDGIELLLSLYADGMAAPDESRRVAVHLATCADCRESLAWMQATHRALASRPIVAPPANLQARIAEAIAASSVAPVRLSPVRTFSLRPAYAAAASLTVLGIALSVSLLHHSTPSPTLSAVPPRVAVVPKSASVTPARQDHPLVAQVKPRPHATVHPAARHQERLANAVVPPPESSLGTSRLEREYPAVSVVKAPPVRAVEKSSRQVSPPPVLLAQTVAKQNPEAVKHQLSPAPPIPTAPAQIASVPKALPPSVPVNIGPPTVTTQPERPHTQLASGISGDVVSAIRQMQHEGYATVVKSASHAALNVHNFESGDTAVYPITYGNLANK